MAESAAEEKLIDVLQFISKERNIPFEMLLEALEAALLTAYKRHYGSEANAIVIVDRNTGEYRVYHRRNVVDTVEDPKLEVSVKQAGGPYQAGRLLRRRGYAERIRTHCCADGQASDRATYP